MIEHWLNGLVHASAKTDPDMRVLHKRLITLRIISGLAVLAVLPAMVAISSGLAGNSALLVTSLAATILAAVILSTTGSLVAAQLFASACYCVAVISLVKMTGLSNSPLLLLLVFLPFEAQVSRRRSAALGAGAMSVAAVVYTWVVQHVDYPGNASSPEALLTASIVAVALVFSTLTTIMVMGQRSRSSQHRRQVMARSRLMLESVGDTAPCS